MHNCTNAQCVRQPAHSPQPKLQEASTLAALRHPNIVSLLGVCPMPPCLVTEYYSQVCGAS